ncbi:CheR family methyltransferase [Thetidibacter halocola]|uniref:Chemotaxis protein methyltransferase n=1 Tax=Thetidibacter halocola TaxID=2827239 RepID=A0A8J7WCD5_9RHOB|nr:protein-glutamate O-methyltransferase CheR [Thetidibacter halocola]MBS0124957.1 protein-glutamate O-methyltransferase CheR [Thetidibacter halocola]
MSMVASGVAPREDIPFTDADFQMLAGLARREFGLDLAASKKPLVYSRLSRRVKARGLVSFADYLALVTTKGENEERLALISALTTNVTSFFREKHHFETLTTVCLRQARAKLDAGGRFRIWSAGCSTGQEPYSIAMTILAAWPDALRRDVRVLATDIDPIVVDRARQGIYSGQDAEALGKDPYRKWIRDSDDGTVSITDEPRALITFAELNLMDPWPFKGPFDAIFCRNVAIYFDQPTQQALWQRFAGLLTETGNLFIGHSERISGPAETSLQACGVTSYRKVTESETKPSNRSIQWV